MTGVGLGGVLAVAEAVGRERGAGDVGGRLACLGCGAGVGELAGG
jgi:hypothetical protein